MRHFLKTQIARIRPSYIERVLAVSLIKNRFGDLQGAKRFERREEMWLYALSLATAAPLRFLEFGVWKGYSINFFAEHCDDPAARFLGFDSFEGLPEAWTPDMPKHAFSTDGSMPTPHDDRVSFIAGWFDETLSPFLAEQDDEFTMSKLIVHFDADLYSSTLYCLVELDRLKRDYYAIFDEFFSGHETRALNDYATAYGATVEMLAKVGDSVFPAQIFCQIRPKKCRSDLA